MSKDYKTTGKPAGGAGARPMQPTTITLLTGILIGLVLGLSIALAVAWYINKMPTPFSDRGAPADAGKGADAGAAKGIAAAPLVAPAPAKPRFEFYKILPGAEEPITEQQLKEAQTKGGDGKDSYFLQAGAFQNAAEADGLKARFALLGVETTIQTTTTPDKGVWHRVRAGPYASIAELDTARAMFKKNGVETTIIRIPASPQPDAK